MTQPAPTESTDSAGEPVLDGQVFDAVLFDMDGTLIDSTPAVVRSWLRWASEFGVDPSFRDQGHGLPARALLASLVAAEDVETSIARVLELELADTDDIVVLPGAVALMGSIPEARRAIVTSCARPLADVRLAATQFPAPAVVVTVDDTPRGKPHPEPYLEGARRLGFDPARCLVIEDAPAGLAAGRAAGCATIGVAGTHAVADLDADFVVRSLADLRVTVTPDGLLLHHLVD
ncbi:HAD family hydrolase [Cryobacterium melibiosiphilum]|uniref:HAD family hydrolase n=1 Tax=Cryobacterium melibiosiphilum TaxID=995039 RepID=A0A3A5MNG7_9MICO|nr:HAD-IA family hydrolase [Cryobacterium melibiosiphilum]RJT90611.1 HAD family hydrolase [Cryobacterium melibiosiphilum]